MRFFKIIGNNVGDFPYKIGMNDLSETHETFNPEKKCVAGGLYFSNEKHICAFLGYGTQICSVTIPSTAHPPVNLGQKWKTDKIIIEDVFLLSEIATWQMLVEKGVDICASNHHALDWAAEEGHLSVVKFLVAGCRCICPDHGDWALVAAARMGHLDVVQFLVVEHGALDETGAALREAAIHGHLSVVMFLHKLCAGFRPQDDTGLDGAAENGHVNVVRFLLERGANVHSTREYALRWAAKNGHLEVVKLLVEYGANIHALNGYALMWAARKGHSDVVQFLLTHAQCGHDVALKWADEEGHEEVVDLLMAPARGDKRA